MATTPVCSYCGKTWTKVAGDFTEIPQDLKDKIKSHIESCDKHPLGIEIEKLKAENAEQLIIIQDLSLIVRRLCQKAPKDDWMYVAQARDYLQRKGLQGNLLRKENQHE